MHYQMCYLELYSFKFYPTTFTEILMKTTKQSVKMVVTVENQERYPVYLTVQWVSVWFYISFINGSKRII